MDQKYFDEIKAREQKATPGPWKIGDGSKQSYRLGKNAVVSYTFGNIASRPIYSFSNSEKYNEYVYADMDFIAHARTDIPLLLAEVERLTAENAKLKKALELMATYLVHFGRIDEMLCDDIPQLLHLKYQPKNDGDYENGPCIQCVQEYFQQQAQQTHETQEEKSDMRQTQGGKGDSKDGEK